MKSKYITKLLISSVFLFFVGCGSGDTADSAVIAQVDKVTEVQAVEEKLEVTPTAEDSTITGSGYYMDSAIEGVEFNCGNQKGSTDKDGKFTYQKGKDCQFKINDMVLRDVKSDDLSDGVKILEDNLSTAQLLQSLDNDANATNGIKITKTTIEVLKEQKISKVPTIEDEIKAIVEMLKSYSSDYQGAFITIIQVEIHLNLTKTQLGIDIKEDISTKVEIVVEEKIEVVETPQPQLDTPIVKDDIKIVEVVVEVNETKKDSSEVTASASPKEEVIEKKIEVIETPQPVKVIDDVKIIEVVVEVNQTKEINTTSIEEDSSEVTASTSPKNEVAEEPETKEPESEVTASVSPQEETPQTTPTNENIVEDTTPESVEEEEVTEDNTTQEEITQTLPQNIILKESFENLRSEQGWHVLNGDVTGDHGAVWDTHTNGIELERGIVSDSADGDVHAELDAHHNITISTELKTNGAKEYTLSFQIKPREKPNSDIKYKTSAMEIELFDKTISIQSDKIGDIYLYAYTQDIKMHKEKQSNGWWKVELVYSNVEDTSNVMTIKGTGEDDSYGMLLDDIELSGEAEEVNNQTTDNILNTEIIDENTLVIVEPDSNLNNLTLTKVDSVDMSEIKAYKVDENSIENIPSHINRISDIFQFDNISNGEYYLEVPFTLNNIDNFRKIRIYTYNKEKETWYSTILNMNFIFTDNGKNSIKINIYGNNKIPFFIGLNNIEDIKTRKLRSPTKSADKDYGICKWQKEEEKKLANKSTVTLEKYICTKGNNSIELFGYYNSIWSKDDTQKFTPEDIANWAINAQSLFDSFGMSDYDKSFKISLETQMKIWDNDLEIIEEKDCPSDKVGSYEAGFVTFGDDYKTLNLSSSECLSGNFEGTTIHEYFHHAQARNTITGQVIVIGGYKDKKDDYVDYTPNKHWITEGTANWIIGEKNIKLKDNINIPKIMEVGLNSKQNAKHWSKDEARANQYLKYPFWKLVSDSCSFKNSNNIRKIFNIKEKDTKSDPSAIKNFMKHLTVFQCKFGVELGDTDKNNLSEALLAYQYETLYKSPMDIWSSSSFEKVKIYSKTELESNSNIIQNNIGSIPAYGAYSFKVSSDIWNRENSTKLKITSNKDLTISILKGTDSSLENHETYITKIKAEHLFNKEEREELFITIINPNDAKATINILNLSTVKEVKINLGTSISLDEQTTKIIPINKTDVDNRIDTIECSSNPNNIDFTNSNTNITINIPKYSEVQSFSIECVAYDSDNTELARDSIDVTVNKADEVIEAKIISFTSNPTTPKQGVSFTVTAKVDKVVNSIRVKFGFDSWENTTSNDGGITWTYTKSGGINQRTNASVDINNDGAVHDSLVIDIEVDAPIQKPIFNSGVSIANITGGFKLRWNQASGATRYELYQSTSSSSLGSKIYSGSSLYYSKTGLSDGIRYYYTVKACNSAGCTTGDQDYKTYLAPIQKPTFNSGVAISGITGGFKLRWNQASGATRYELYQSTSSSSLGSKIYSGSSLYYSKTGLSDGIRYYYTVKACNSAGCTTGDQDYKTYLAPIQKPTFNSGVAISGITGGFKLRWNQASGATRYELYQSTSSSSLGSKIYSGSSLYYSKTGLSDGIRYYYTVKACNSAGCTTGDQDYKTYLAPIVIPTVSLTYVTATGTAGDTKFRFDARLSSSLPSGYSVYLNFDNTEGNYFNLGDDGGYVGAMNCSGTSCSFNRAIRAGGDREVRALVSKTGSKRIEGSYSNSKLFKAIPRLKGLNSVIPSSGYANSTNFRFKVDFEESDSKMPSGYIAYLNFDNLVGNQFKEYDAGGHIDLDCYKGSCYLDRTVGSKGDRYLRAGISKGDKNPPHNGANSYTSYKTVTVR